MLILVAVETRSSMNENGTNALILRRLRHIQRFDRCNFRIYQGIAPRGQAEVKIWMRRVAGESVTRCDALAGC